MMPRQPGHLAGMAVRNRQLLKTVLLQQPGKLRIERARHGKLTETDLDRHLLHGSDAVRRRVVEILDRGLGAAGERRRVLDEPQQRMGIEQERHLPVVGEVVQRCLEVGRNIGFL